MEKQRGEERRRRGGGEGERLRDIHILAAEGGVEGEGEKESTIEK